MAACKNESVNFLINDESCDYSGREEENETNGAETL